MNAAIIAIIADIVAGLIPVVAELVTKGIAGHDITHDELWARLPHDSRVTAHAKILFEQRKALGLPV